MIRDSWFIWFFLLVSVTQALIRPQIPDGTENSASVEKEDLLTALRMTLSPIKSHRVSARPSPFSHYVRYGTRKVGHFSWNTCGGSADPFQITNLTLSPDPVKLGTPIKVTASGQITLDLDSPLEVVVQVQKKVYVWITLPCVDDLGSCTYPDLCARLPPPPCPQPLIDAGLPCSCPFPAGSYTVKDLEVEFDTTKFPGWLTEGDFKAHIEVKKAGQSIACYDIELNIVS